MWFPGFLSFLEPRGLICKVEIETSLHHRTVQRVTFLITTTDRAMKESIPGHEHREVGPDWLPRYVTFPLLFSRPPHVPAALGGQDQQPHLAKRGPECSSCGSLDPPSPRASPWELTFISPGPPPGAWHGQAPGRQCSGLYMKRNCCFLENNHIELRSISIMRGPSTKDQHQKSQGSPHRHHQG